MSRPQPLDAASLPDNEPVAWQAPPANLMQTYHPLEVDFVVGRGTRLWDRQGREYLDAIAGVGVTQLGHAHPAVVEAIADQAGKLLHVSNLYGNRWQLRLAERLAGLSGMQRMHFSNSGAEANEAALKLARLYARRRGVARPRVVVMENAFHGRTLATLSACGNDTVRAGFEPLVEDYVRVPLGDVAALEAATREHGADIVAVLAEPVQGEGGVQVAPPGYLKALREHCTRHGWLLMLDEAQSGMGRTGRWFAFQHEGIVPDVLTMAKGLANGVPIGACLARGEAAELFTPGSHGSTFGGNPLACRAACATLDAIEREGLLANAARQGQTLLDGLRRTLAGRPSVVDVRGLGLMIGIELDRPCRELMLDALREHRLLINVTHGNTVRLLPPLVLDAGEVQRIVEAIGALVR
ncbi:acetylornithine transaminase [Frateuria defendens]|uniref:acetylornithine transaminase n=1 Tax=Frateuria defendens TaxID=2219559 RepID=UPI0009E4554A|nr:acetylornithine transaminase [Frateuria defendens]